MIDDEKQKLLWDFEKAGDKLRAQPKGRMQNLHDDYGRCYQLLVKAGLRPQIKKKYRGR